MSNTLQTRQLSMHLTSLPAQFPPMSFDRIQRFTRHWARMVLVAVVVLATGPAVFAQGSGETKTLKSVTDGWPIHITYFPAKAKDSDAGAPDAGVVVLVHGQGGDRLVWEQKLGDSNESLVDKIQKLGLAVVTVDMRKHGESKTDPSGNSDATLHHEDYQHMWQGDLEAVKQFLFEEHQKKMLNMNKLAIVAADDMAPIAAQFALFDWSKPPYDDAPITSRDERTPRGQDVRALVFLSPSMAAGSISIMSAIKDLRNPRAGIAMLALAGAQDSDHSTTVRNIERVMKGVDRKGERSYFHSFPDVKFSGADLFGKPNVPTDVLVVNFLEKHVAKLDSPWRDRRSRLDRN